MKFFAVFVLVLAFFGSSHAAFEKMDELVKKFGQDPVVVRQQMIKLIDELEKSANAALDQAHDGTKKAGDLLHEGMLKALEMARKFLDKKSENANNVLNKVEELILVKIAEFQQGLITTQTTGRSGKQDLAWEILYSQTKSQMEIAESIMQNSEISDNLKAKYQADVDKLKQELEILNKQNDQATSGPEYRQVRRSWTILSRNLKAVSAMISAAVEKAENPEQ